MIESIVADLHCHTLASSHAYSTLTEVASAAASRGLMAVACTDHGIGTQDAPHLWHFLNQNILPPYIAGVRVLHGVEANVMDFSGKLDMSRDVLEKLDIVVASMHNGAMPRGEDKDITEAWLGVAENPEVDIIGHSGAPLYAFDYEKVIPVFGRNGKVVEINEGTFKVRSSSVPNCRRIAELCKKYGVRVVVDSDAHFHEAVGVMTNSLALLREVEFPAELIVNGSRENFLAYLRGKNIPV